MQANLFSWMESPSHSSNSTKGARTRTLRMLETITSEECWQPTQAACEIGSYMDDGVRSVDLCIPNSMRRNTSYHMKMQADICNNCGGQAFVLHSWKDTITDW